MTRIATAILLALVLAGLPGLGAEGADTVRVVTTIPDLKSLTEAVGGDLVEVESLTRGTQNLLHPMRDALKAKATLGEVSDALREVFGLYQPSR